LTLTLGSDGNLHVYTTGTTTDVVTPCAPLSVTSVQITAPNIPGVNLTIDSSDGNPIPAGSLTYGGPGGLIKTGAGTVTLSGTSTYTGGTTIRGGAIVFSSPSSLPTTGIINVSRTGTVNLTYLFGSLLAGQTAPGTSNSGTTAATTATPTPAPTTTTTPITTAKTSSAPVKKNAPTPVVPKATSVTSTGKTSAPVVKTLTLPVFILPTTLRVVPSPQSPTAANRPAIATSVTPVQASAHDAVLQSGNVGQPRVEATSVSAAIHSRVQRQPSGKPGSTAELFDAALAVLLS
jgi:autotransporter-associated beta strand protein